MTIGRNDACACGSGKKHKRCCGAKEASDFADMERREREIRRDAAQRESVWAADAVPVNISVQDGTASRPVMLIVAAGDVLLESDVIGWLGGEAEDVARALEGAVVRVAHNVGVFPWTVRVRHDEVAAALAPLLAPRDVEVEAGETPQLESGARELLKQLSGTAYWPPIGGVERWTGWKLPLRRVGEIFTTAARYYRAAPWDQVSHLQAPRVELPSGRVWTCSVMGRGLNDFGLALYSDPADCFEQISIVDPHQAFDSTRGRIISLLFYTAEREELREARLNGWEVVGPTAYPRLTTVNTPGGGVSRADIDDLLLMLKVMPAFALEHLDVLTAEDRTGKAVEPIVWTDPATGVVCRYNGEGVTDATFGNNNHAFEDSPGLPELNDIIQGVLAEVGPDANVETVREALTRHVERRIGEHNNAPQPDLGGLSPVQVQALLEESWFAEDSLLHVSRDLTMDDVGDCDFIVNIRTLLDYAVEHGGRIGATQAGYLQMKVVDELLDRLRLHGPVDVYRSSTRRITEQHVGPLHLARITAETALLLKPHSTHFALTSIGMLLRDDENIGELYSLLLMTWFRSINLEYVGRMDWPALQFQVSYTLYRLQVVAKEWRTPDELLDDVVLPAALADGSASRIAREIALRHCILDPLVSFGLMERRERQYRTTPLAGKAMSFNL